MAARQTEKKITALYERLSRDDDQLGESNSIVNQKAYLESYAAQHGFLNCAHYTDDGWSGGNFDRPDWKRLIADIEAGKIATVLVKDMSRIGRDYLQTGFYTEVVFRKHHVRFIAIANGIDSNDPGTSEFAPFMNIMNEWYLRDISRKVRVAKRTKGEAGKPVASMAPYGYMKPPGEKDKWIIDEEAAEVVRRVFRMVVEGKTCWAIAKSLERDQIENPTVHFARQGRGKWKDRTTFEHPYRWKEHVIYRMLDRPEYLGHTVNFRSHTESYKDPTQVNHPKEEWMIFENTHEPIIDKETWDLAQKLRKTPRRVDTIGEPNPLTGLLFCADCGAKMYNCRRRANSEKKRSAKDYYECSTHKTYPINSQHTCSTHYVPTKAIHELVLETIRQVSRYALENEEAFNQQIRNEAEIQYESAAKDLRKKMKKDKRRRDELDVLLKRLYESYALGKLPEKRYELLSAQYEQEQAELEDALVADQLSLDSFLQDTTRIDQFMELSMKYTDFSELTTPMLNEFVDKIMVHAPVYDPLYGRTQQVDVYLNFVGCVQIPTPEPTTEELEELESLAKRRERNRRYYERKKARERQNKLLVLEQPASGGSARLSTANSYEPTNADLLNSTKEERMI